MKRALILLAIALLLGAGYFTYVKWSREANLNLWSFIPSSAFLVYESDRPLQSFDSLLTTNIWLNLESVDDFREMPGKLKVLDTLAGEGNFRKFFSENPALISLSVTSSRSFDFLFVVEIQNLSQQSFISKAQAYFENRGYSKKTRSYNGFTISELIHEKENLTFAYIFYKNFFIGSFSPFLVEDAIRTVSEEEQLDFTKTYSELLSVAKLEQDFGNLYLNLNKLGSMKSIFAQEDMNLDLAKSAYLDLDVLNDHVNMTGFSFTEDPSDFLYHFKGIPAGSFDMTEIVPEDASWFYHMSSSDATALGNAIQKYSEFTRSSQLDLQKKLLKDLDFDVRNTFNLVDEEIGVIALESAVTGDYSEMLILEIKDMGEALKFFNGVGERYAQKNQDSIYQETYGGNYLIRKLPVANYSVALLGDLAKATEELYYLQYRNYLVFCNSLPRLKNFTHSIEDENTWTKSLRINKFLQKANKEANLSYFVNTPRAWNQIIQSLKPKWSQVISENSTTFKNLEFLSFQFTAVDEKFYTNVTVYQPKAPVKGVPQQIKPLQALTLPAPITTKPWIVTNHNDRSREVFVQDSSHSIYLVSADFSVLWEKSLREPISTGIEQIDYYKNGKLQYAFATKSAVHIIDRTGAYIPEFPKALPNGAKIAYFNIIDYDRSRNYRFSLTDEKGNVYLTDKNVRPLEGWNPKKFKSNLVQSPVHHRINGKDLILALEQDGMLNLFTRRGSEYNGFPIETKTEIIEPPFVKNTNTLETSTISMISKTGELIEISFSGELIGREQLYKPGVDTEFKMMPDVTGSSFLILRKTGTSHSILDASGNQLFEKDYFTPSALHYQYYQLGGGDEFVILVDPTGNYLYIYDRDGNLLTGRPLASDQPVSILKQDNSYKIYRVSGRSLEQIVLDL